MSTEMYKVKNRSAGVATYSIPELHVRRRFAPGEVKQISAEELDKLTYQPGGLAILTNFLQIQSDEGLQRAGIHPQPEYFMTEADIINLLKNGSMDSFLDCLDFAPPGVIDLIKTLSVTLPLNDVEKRNALKEKTGFDCDAALRHEKEDKEAEKSTSGGIKPERRVKMAAEAETAEAPARRTTANYKVTFSGNKAE